MFGWMRRFHNGADATLVPTNELAEFLRGRGFTRVELLRRAVDTALFDPARRDDTLRAQWGAGPDDLVVIHVGRFAPEKNLALAGARLFRGDQPARRRRLLVHALAVVLVPFTASVAVSRVVLGLRYPSDVLAAMAVDLSLATASLSFV